MTSLARRAIPVFFQGGGFQHPKAFANASWNICVRGVERPLLGIPCFLFLTSQKAMPNKSVFAPADNNGGRKTRYGVQQGSWASNGACSETDHQRVLRFGGQPCDARLLLTQIATSRGT